MKKIHVSLFSVLVLLSMSAHFTFAQCNVSGSISGSPCVDGGNLSASISGNPFQIDWKLNGSLLKSEYATWDGNGITVAGGNGQGGGSNQFYYPQGIFVDNNNNVYVTDPYIARIQKWAPGATDGITVAGGNGQGTGANQVGFPLDVFVDPAGNMYIADYSNGRVAMWAPGSTSGVTVAGGNGNGSADNQIGGAVGVFVDAAGSVYVCDQINDRVQKWDAGATSGVTVAGGNGEGNAPNQLNHPSDIAVDASGNVFVCDYANHRIQEWTPGATAGITVAGDGTINGGLFFPQSIAVDRADNLYIADPSFGFVKFWPAGASSGTTVAFINSYGIALSSNYDIYISSITGYSVLKFPINNITSSSNPISTTGTYSLVMHSFDGCTSNAPDFNVYALPMVTTGTLLSVCNGSNITLTAANTGGYVWTPGNQTGESFTVSPAATTTYTVTDQHTCTTTTTVAVNNNNPVTISGAACSGTVLTASLASIPASLQWQKNGVTVHTEIPGWNKNAVTVAGGNGGGFADNQLGGTYLGITIDALGNLYIADQSNNRISKWVPGASTGTTIIGGFGGGVGASQLNGPAGIFLDASQNVYIADAFNHRIQKWAPGASEGVTVAGGNGSGGDLNQLNFPVAVSVDQSGNIYVLDRNNDRVVKWAPGATEGIVVAGGLNFGTGMAVDEGGNIYITAYSGNRVQKWTPGSANGITIMTGLNGPTGLWQDAAGYFYVVNFYDFTPTVVRFREGDRSFTNLFGGTSGSGSDQLSRANNGCFDANGNMYILDANNFRVQKFSPSSILQTYTPTTSGDYTAVATSFAGCTAVSNVISDLQAPVVSSDVVSICNGSTATISVSTGGNFSWNPGNLNGSSVTVSPASTTTYTVTDGGNQCSSTVTVNVDPSITPSITGSGCLGIGNLTASVPNSPLKVEWKLNGSTVSTINSSYSNSNAVIVAGGNGAGSGANQLQYPRGMCLDAAGNVYAAEEGSLRITKWTPGATQGIVVAGGNGYGSASNQLSSPEGVFVDKHGNLYVADDGNARIQEFTPGSTNGITVAGGNGEGTDLNQLSAPWNVFVDDAGNIYVAEYFNDRVTKWSPGATQGIIVAGGNGRGTAANQLWSPDDVLVDGSGNVYVSDQGNNRVQKWAPGASSGITVAGDGTFGYGPVQLNSPTGIALDGAGNLYVVNEYYSTIWKWAPGATSGVYVAGYCCSGTGSLNAGFAVRIAPDGSVYAANYGGCSIVKYPVNKISNTSFTPSTPGDYTAVTTSFAGCTAASNTISVFAVPTITLSGNQYICTGGSTTLDAANHQQYLWSNSATTQSTSFNSAGNDSVKVTDNGCNATKKFTITSQTPVMNVTANPSSICVGNSTQLNASLVSGGQPDSYSWFPAAPPVANPVVTLFSTTTYTLTTTSLACTSTSTVTVNVSTPGDTSVFGDHVWNVYAFNDGGSTLNSNSWNDHYSGYYVDNNLNLNSESYWPSYGSPSYAPGYQGCPVGTDNHSWSAKRKGFPCGTYQIDIPNHDDAAQLFVNGVNVWEHDGCCDSHINVWTGFLDDNSTITYRVTEGGGGSNGSINIISKSVIAAQGPTTICPGYSILLDGGINDSYLWSTGETTPTITVNAAGTYSLTTSVNGCVNTSSQQILVAPLDTPAITSYYNFNYCPQNYGVDLNIDYNALYASILWSGGENYSNIFVYSPGNYSVTVSDALGCSATSHAVVTAAQGADSTFGNNVWRVNTYLEGDEQDFGYSWLPQDYSGYYLDSTLNFNSQNKWNENSNPSTAPGYQGCSVYDDFISWNAKRQGFLCGTYQIDVLNNDDEGQLWIDGVLVWERDNYSADSVINVWTGFLGLTSKVEFKVTEGFGSTNGRLAFTLLSSTGTILYADADNDGYGNPNISVQGCDGAPGYVADNTDCNDSNGSVYPGATEVCNSIDDNCDGQVDEGVKNTFYADTDHDTYGNAGSSTQACSAPTGYVANHTDCNDSNGSVYPGATEVCNAIDDNCNGLIDEGVKSTFYADTDHDTYGNAATSTQACSAPSGYVSNSTDCNDNNASIHPGAADICNAIDDNCNGVIDENAIAATITPGGSVTFCAGSSLTLTANSGSGTSYQWIKNSKNISGATKQTYVATQTASYQVKESNSFSCNSTSATTSVTKVAKPTATIIALGNLNICASGSVTLQANAGTGLIYQWVKGTANITGATGRNYTATAKGTYKCIVTNSSSCSKISNGLKVIHTCHKEDEENNPLSQPLMTIYPNPTNGKFMIDLKIDEATSGQVKIIVMNIVGQVVYAENGDMLTGEIQKEISLSPGAASGIYIVKAIVNNNTYESKLVIQH